MPSRLFENMVQALEQTYGKVSQKTIAAKLGVSQAAVSNWITGRSEPNKTSIGKLLGLFAEHQASSLISPIVEFEPIIPVRSGASWRLAPENEERVKPLLQRKKGIYVFYDSSGRATYLGKSEKDLWGEAKQRLKAPANRPFYNPGKKAHKEQGEITRFLSAYEVVVPAAIKNMESFMLRAFANDLMNRNGGKFKKLI